MFQLLHEDSEIVGLRFIMRQLIGEVANLGRKHNFAYSDLDREGPMILPIYLCIYSNFLIYLKQLP